MRDTNGCYVDWNPSHSFPHVPKELRRSLLLYTIYVNTNGDLSKVMGYTDKRLLGTYYRIYSATKSDVYSLPSPLTLLKMSRQNLYADIAEYVTDILTSKLFCEEAMVGLEHVYRRWLKLPQKRYLGEGGDL